MVWLAKETSRKSKNKSWSTWKWRQKQLVVGVAIAVKKSQVKKVSRNEKKTTNGNLLRKRYSKQKKRSEQNRIQHLATLLIMRCAFFSSTSSCISARNCSCFVRSLLTYIYIYINWCSFVYIYILIKRNQVTNMCSIKKLVVGNFILLHKMQLLLCPHSNIPSTLLLHFYQINLTCFLHLVDVIVLVVVVFVVVVVDVFAFVVVYFIFGWRTP